MRYIMILMTNTWALSRLAIHCRKQICISIYLFSFDCHFWFWKTSIDLICILKLFFQSTFFHRRIINCDHRAHLCHNLRLEFQTIWHMTFECSVIALTLCNKLWVNIHTFIITSGFRACSFCGFWKIGQSIHYVHYIWTLNASEEKLLKRITFFPITRGRSSNFVHTLNVLAQVLFCFVPVRWKKGRLPTFPILFHFCC